MRYAVICVCLIILGGFVQAEVFNTGAVIKSGHFSLNFEEQYNIDPEDFTFFFHVGIGLVNNVSDLCITVGFPSEDGQERYTGVDVEFALKKAHPAISWSIGVHDQYDFGIDSTFLISGRFDQIRPYIGLDYDLNFGDPDDYYKLNAVLGMEARFSTNAGFLVEAGTPVSATNDADTSYISLGLVVYF